MSEAKHAIPRREDAPAAEKWNLNDIFDSVIEWTLARDSLPMLFDSIRSYQGKLGDPQQLLDCFEAVDLMDIRLSSVYAWAKMRADTDATNTAYQAQVESVAPLLDQAGAACSFINPELLDLPDEQLAAMPDALPALKKYKFLFQEIVRTREHVLPQDIETILAQTGELRAAGSNAYYALINADMKFPDTLGEDGQKVPLSVSRFMTLQRSKNREVRKQSFTNLYDTYLSFRNTFVSTYQSSVKAHQFINRVRHFPSMIAGSLDVGNIPLSVYDRTIEVTHDFLPLLHRYMETKRRLLGIDQVHMYDLSVPIVDHPQETYSFEDARAILQEALAPLGPKYLNDIDEALESGWVDRCENQGKCSGAYSWGVYGAHPYILMTWNDTYESVSTLAHELGHSMHSYYSHRDQPYPTSAYTIFCAETASLTNENLLLEYMLEHAWGQERFYYLNLYLEQIRTTVFRQVMFAEFEKITHETIEKGDPLTADFIEKTWMDLNRMYYGDQVVVDDSLRGEWSRISHFYNPFYVYQYATGYAAAMTLSYHLRTQGEPAREKYLRYLSSGGCDYSINLLKNAGVDMTSRAPFTITFRKFRACLDELEKFLPGI